MQLAHRLDADVPEQARRRAHDLRSQAVYDAITAGVAGLRSLGREVLSRFGARSKARCESCPA